MTHYIRNQKEFTNIEYYIIENPVKAGLIEDWQQWKFTYWVENI
jgi:putative transposase